MNAAGWVVVSLYTMVSGGLIGWWLRETTEKMSKEENSDPGLCA